MAQQFITLPASPLTESDTNLLYQNLVENIAYRRAQQNLKNREKMRLERQMATGMIPEAEITVTDEGYRFEGEGNIGNTLLGFQADQTSPARQAWLKSMGALDPAEDRTRRGFTNTYESELEGQQQAFAKMQAKAAEDAANAIPPHMRAMGEGNYADLSQFMRGTIDDMNNLPNRTGRSLEENARTATDAFGRMQETILNPDGSTPTAPSQPEQPTPSPFIGPPTAPAPSGPATPASLGAMLGKRMAEPPTAIAPATRSKQAPVKPDDKGRASGGIKVAEAFKDMGSATVENEYGGYNVTMPYMTQKTVATQYAQIDEIKRSIPKLAGLAALEDYGNQLANVRGYNTVGDSGNVFSTMLKQRVADLDRWEKGQTLSGVQTAMEKQGEFKTDIDKSSQKLSVMRRGENKQDMSTRVNLDTGDKGAKNVLVNFITGDPSKVVGGALDPTLSYFTGYVSGLGLIGMNQTQFKDGNAVVNYLENVAAKRGQNESVKVLAYQNVKMPDGSVQKQPERVEITTAGGGKLTGNYNPYLRRTGNEGLQAHGWLFSTVPGTRTEAAVEYLNQHYSVKP
jgi:hypothetical protein